MAALAYSLCSWTSCAPSPTSSAAMDSHQVLLARPTPSPSIRLERQAQLPPLPTCSPPNSVARSTTAAGASSPCRRRREVLMKPQLHLVPLPVTNAVAPRALVGELPYQQQVRASPCLISLPSPRLPFLLPSIFLSETAAPPVFFRE
ncbi:hypothetical protein CFC21_083885 [Triticum aestivum]|uniref:Uncharacterized protein n=3 Tax=Triticum TaxID=4564 RepID=A0A9R0Y2V4_TRITD|nr:hypothetical protein CFC21_083885 [Triticum aestivum]VAI47763.1 unnamed protein product [Triticum turgidum subsp. durum]